MKPFLAQVSLFRQKNIILKMGIVVLTIVLIQAMIFQNVQADDTPQNFPTTPTADQSALPTPTPILKLIFPETSSHPVSGWRPSLLPIPYALGPYDHFYFARPIAVTTVNWPLADYRYGYKDSETNTAHTGVDIDAQLHTPILAAGDGKVVFTGYGLSLGGAKSTDPYGLAVMIRHDFSFEGRSIETVYAHMAEITVKVGDLVKTGDQLGYVGMTGNTTGPHVHFEVRLESPSGYLVQNPELWMVPPTDDGVLLGIFVGNNGKYLSGKTVTVKNKATSKSWTVYTYFNPNMKRDPYFQENMVLSDLPKGDYTVTVYDNYKTSSFDVSISPGAITHIYYKTGKGFSLIDSTTQELSFLIPY